MAEFLKYIVSIYGKALYQDGRKLSNLITDLYRGDEHTKQAYRRAILDDNLPLQIHKFSLKPLDEWEALYARITAHFAKFNFYQQEIGRQIVDSFVHGIQLEIAAPISTEATEEDGEWIDEFGVKYSKDRKKLIKGRNGFLYNILNGTVAICNEAFSNCSNLHEINIPIGTTEKFRKILPLYLHNNLEETVLD